MKIVLLVAVLACFISCDHASDAANGRAEDSVSTDSLQNPSYNPEVEVDSATKQMNLDSTDVKK